MFRYSPLGNRPRYTRCYRCGHLLGMSRVTLTAVEPGPVGGAPVSIETLEAMRHKLAMRRFDGYQDYCQRCRKKSDWNEDLPFSEHRPAREDALGHVVTPRLLAEAHFAVYGLKGNPQGLRLRDMDLRSGGDGGTILRYTAGGPDSPERALDLYQGISAGAESPAVVHRMELRVIVGLVLGCAPREQREFYLNRGNIHRDWNLDYLGRARRRTATIQIGGRPTEVDLAHWQEPQQVAQAHLALDGRPALAVSLGFSTVQLLALLKSLVSLREDADALAEHDRDYRAF